MDDRRLWDMPESEKIKALQKGLQDLLELLYPPNRPIRVELDLKFLDE